MKDLHPIRGRNYIRELIAEGEHEHQDFKFAISDARKIARSISAFANNDGGRLLVGVKDNGVIAGIRSEEEVYMIETAAEIYCRPSVQIEMTAFKADRGLLVLRASIPRELRPPVYVVEQEGRLKAYFRVKDENMVAPDILIRSWEIYGEESGTLLQLDERHKALLQLIEAEGHATVERYMQLTHSSRHLAVDLFGRLIASSVVKLIHTPAGFAITSPD